MIQDKNTLAFYASPGKHATIMREKYWAKRKPLPGMTYDLAGYIKGKGIEVVMDEETGLPIPATAEGG